MKSFPLKWLAVMGVLGWMANTTAADWPLFRGDRGLTGVASGKFPNQPELLWKFKVGDPVLATAVIGDGHVYFGADDGKVYCLKLADGEKVWEFKTKDPFEAPPMLLDGRVYVGDLFGNFFALNAKDGQQVWKFETGAEIHGGANWIMAPDGKSKYVLVGSHDNFLYALDAKNGEKKWELECEQPINGSPTLANGRTMFGGCDALLHLINVKNGKRDKTIDAKSYIIASVAAQGDEAFVGHRDSEFLAFDLKAGNVKWSYKDRRFPYESSAAVTKDRVLFGGQDKRLHCVRRDNGEVVWTYSTRSAVDSSPVVVDGKVIVGSNDDHVHMVALADGKEIWKFKTGDAVTASPAVADGRVVIGSTDGFVYCFGAKKK